MDFPSRILLATGSAHKVREIRAILRPLLPPGVELVGLADAGLGSPPPEVERFRSFTGNARAKAAWCREKSGLACIADDSGICVDALGGKPGVRSARWAGPTDSDRNRRLVEELNRVGAVAERQRTARFVCAAAYAGLDMDRPVVALGRVRGRILDRPEGAGGFGYDPLFYCPELGASFAEAGEAAKQRVSHRARALVRLLFVLRSPVL
jgi:XTP/dITP diphosphohydrolase